MSLSLSYYSAIKTAAPTAWSWVVSSTLSLLGSLSLSILLLISMLRQHTSSFLLAFYFIWFLYFTYIITIYTHTITHILTRVYSQAERHTHKQKFIHTNVCSQFTAVFCFSPLAFSIAFALTRSLRRLLPYAHPSPPLPSTSTSLPTSQPLLSLVYFTYMLLFFVIIAFPLRICKCETQIDNIQKVQLWNIFVFAFESFCK